jgi:hypothetical protein
LLCNSNISAKKFSLVSNQERKIMKLCSLFSLMMSLSILSANSLLPVQAQKVESENFPVSIGEKYNYKTQQIKAETSRDAKLEKEIRHKYGGFGGVIRYLYNRVDLNGDKKPEILVHLTGSRTVCGSGGCITLVFQSAGQEYRLVSEIGVSSTPIIVTNQKTNGWNNLIFGTIGGYRHQSGTDGLWLLKFNGRSYPDGPEGGVHLPSNATITGKKYFSSQDDAGIKLQL